MEIKKKVKTKSQYLYFMTKNIEYLKDVKIMSDILFTVSKIVEENSKVIDSIRYAGFAESLLLKIKA